MPKLCLVLYLSYVWLEMASDWCFFGCLDDFDMEMSKPSKSTQRNIKLMFFRPNTLSQMHLHSITKHTLNRKLACLNDENANPDRKYVLSLFKTG